MAAFQRITANMVSATKMPNIAMMKWNAANHRKDPHLDRLIGEVKH